MKNLLGQAGREFLRAFGAGLVLLAPGILSAPNLDQMFLLGVAALASSIAAGIKAVQVIIPQLSFSGLVTQPVAAWLDAFSRAFLAAFSVFAIGILTAPELTITRAAVVAGLLAALATGFRALEGLTTKGEQPAPGTGLNR